jgi:hypothetical protein
MNMYVALVAEKYVRTTEILYDNMKGMINGISKLSDNKIPPEFFTASMLADFSEAALKHVQRTHPDYILAIPHISHYYNMDIVSFGIDNDHSLVVTFPIFVKPNVIPKLTLYEIETVPVPIDDLNKDVHSYTQAVMTKPYIATADDHYIQLRMEELRMCKRIKYDYYCEELFLVKSKTYHTCESAIFFDFPAEIVMKVCKFSFQVEADVTPSVLDGGDIIVLANMPDEKILTCTSSYAVDLTSHPYVMTNRSLLCDCKLSYSGTTLPLDIAACALYRGIAPLYYTKNLAFMETYKEMMDIAELPIPPTPADTTRDAPFSDKIGNYHVV